MTRPLTQPATVTSSESFGTFGCSGCSCPSTLLGAALSSSKGCLSCAARGVAASRQTRAILQSMGVLRNSGRSHDSMGAMVTWALAALLALMPQAQTGWEALARKDADAAARPFRKG